MGHTLTVICILSSHFVGHNFDGDILKVTISGSYLVGLILKKNISIHS